MALQMVAIEDMDIRVVCTCGASQAIQHKDALAERIMDPMQRQSLGNDIISKLALSHCTN